MGTHIPVDGVQGMYIGGVQYAKVGQNHTHLEPSRVFARAISQVFARAISSKYIDVKTQNLLGSRSVHDCKLWEVGRFKTSIFPPP